jgi:hypothetical protein
MGYIEETGAAQYLRDVRITSIYEGTNGIQAADLVSRKLGRDNGGAMAELLEAVTSTVAELGAGENAALDIIERQLAAALAQHQLATGQVLAALKESPEIALGASFDYMMMTGYLLGGWHLARSALVANARIESGSDRQFYPQKIATAVFYAEHVLPRCAGHGGSIANAQGTLQSYPVDWL